MKEKIQIIQTESAPKAIGPYSQGLILASNLPLIFVSGQLPIDPQSGKLIEEGIELQTERVIENIRAILRAGGSDLERVLRVEIFCIDLKNDFPKINSVYGKYFTASAKPARQTVQVAGLPLGSPIEISCIAFG